jgi:hypothetical protein
MPMPSTSVINENGGLEISKKHDLSRKRITIFHITNAQIFRIANKLGIKFKNLNYSASNTMEMVAASSSKMREKITNREGIITH